MTLNAENRVNWVDTAKGLGIALLVVGHVIRGLATAHLMEWTSMVQFIDTWIYSFHMPLFFFLSGIFLVRSVTKSTFSAFSSDKLRTIAYPYFVWSIITVLLKFTLGSIPNTPRGLSDLPLIAFAPIEQFWFLYVLFIVTVLLGALYKLGLSPWTVVALAILIYPGLISIVQQWGILELARRNAIYVALGAAIGWNYLAQISGRRVVSLTLVAAIGYGIIIVCIELGVHEILTPILALSGTVATVALAVLLNRAHVDAIVSFFGRHSLEIYVAHTMASAAVRVVLQSIDVRSPIIHLFAGVGAGLLLPLALAFAFKFVGFRIGFTLPKSETPKLA